MEVGIYFTIYSKLKILNTRETIKKKEEEEGEKEEKLMRIMKCNKKVSLKITKSK